jgi:hypothetical protein
MDHISNLPAEIVRSIVSTLLIPDINSLSKSGKKISSYLFDDDRFWRERLKQDFYLKSKDDKRYEHKLYEKPKYYYIKSYKNFHFYARNKIRVLIDKIDGLTSPNERLYHIIAMYQFMLESENYLRTDHYLMVDAYENATILLQDDRIIQDSNAVHILIQYVGKYRHIV